VLDGLYRIILHDLKTGLAVHYPHRIPPSAARETEPQLLQIMAPNEAVGGDRPGRCGSRECSGVINIGMPSIIIKMLRQKFDQQWSVRRTDFDTRGTAGGALRALNLSNRFCWTPGCRGRRAGRRPVAAEDRGCDDLRYPVEEAGRLPGERHSEVPGHMPPTGRKMVVPDRNLHKPGDV